MPYQYVVDAYTNGIKNRQGYLHQLEAPTSLLCSLFANSNRDTKKQKSPYRLNDFFLFQPTEEQDVPTGVYGAAAMKLVEDKMLPLWALTFYADLKRGANGEPPGLLAFLHDKAVLLAPVVDGKIAKGMLIAEGGVSEKAIKMRSPAGEQITLQMPKLTAMYSAQEGVELPIVG